MSPSLSGFEFPHYTGAERLADGIVHILGVTAGGFAAGWLLVHAGPDATPLRLAALSIYCFGLIGMLVASAIYNMAPPSRLKAILRRVDHAMIFVMIAGTYTPFSIDVLQSAIGVPLCAVVWTLAVVGIAVRISRPAHHTRLALALYLGMGWSILPVLRPLIAAVPLNAFLLLLAGGVVYSAGSFIHAHGRLPFHNAIWHAMVCIAAGLHLAAIADALSIPG